MPTSCSKFPVLFLLAALAVATGVSAAEAPLCQAHSGPNRATLVELFTSEGCSSCPPAEQWLAQQLSDHRPDVIPLALHVTYWNDLGWRDRYADAFFDRRQDWYTRFATNRFAYTPELVRDGAEWQDWRSGASPSHGAQPARVSLALEARNAGTGSVQVMARVSPVPGSQAPGLAGSELLVYAYQDGLTQQPDAGELRGVALRHEHVVRGWASVRAPQADQSYRLDISLPAEAAARPTGLVALLQDRGTGQVYQALDLPACAR